MLRRSISKIPDAAQLPEQQVTKRLMPETAESPKHASAYQCIIKNC